MYKDMKLSEKMIFVSRNDNDVFIISEIVYMSSVCREVGI